MSERRLGPLCGIVMLALVICGSCATTPPAPSPLPEPTAAPTATPSPLPCTHSQWFSWGDYQRRESWSKKEWARARIDCNTPVPKCHTRLQCAEAKANMPPYVDNCDDDVRQAYFDNEVASGALSMVGNRCREAIAHGWAPPKEAPYDGY